MGEHNLETENVHWRTGWEEESEEGCSELSTLPSPGLGVVTGVDMTESEF